MNIFSSYRIINAENIVKANIRPDNIRKDADALILVLLPVLYIMRTDPQKAPNLHANVIKKLRSKVYTIDLLNYFGYLLDEQGNYTYQSPAKPIEKTLRENATNEFKRFHEDVIKIRDGTFEGFEDFIRNTQKRPSSAFSDDDGACRRSVSPISRPTTTFRSISPPLLNISTIQRGNQQTSDLIRLFKQNIVPGHGGRPVHSYIRRKLLLLLFKQKYPDAAAVDDELIDSEIDQSVHNLRQFDRNIDLSTGDEVYYECLLRSNFDVNDARTILQNNRPNLKPPPEPEIPRGPTTTTLADSIASLEQQWELLNENTEENIAPQILLHEGDEWKNATHVITAIIKIREQYTDEQLNEDIISKMYRLIYSELSNVIGQQSALKIELLSYALQNVALTTLNHINMSDIKDILRAGSDTAIHENFGENAQNLLSVECPICSESFPRSRMETMFLCDHFCCLDCVKDYYRVTIKDIRDATALKKLTCFQQPVEISEDVKLNFFQYIGSKFNQWFTDERLILDLYHENLFLATRDSQTKKCGNPKCTGFFIPNNNNNNRIARVQCPHCQFQQCQTCSRKWFDDHNGKTCEKFADWLLDNDPDDPEVQLIKYLNTAGMICPNDKCKAVYEYKPGGCEHFTCEACHTEFCRICSALFYNPNHNTICPRPSCSLKKTVHAHCSYNCLREIRDAEIEEFVQLLTANRINVVEELRQKPEGKNLECPVEECKNPPSAECENRFCNRCYKDFLGVLIWRNQIEPWTLNTDGNLRQKLTNASVNVPENAPRETLLALARQHLTQFLGKPKKIERRR